MRTDILVIGGGAIGAAVAYFTKVIDPGAEIAVVERDPGYRQASTPRIRRRAAAFLFRRTSS